MSDDGGLSKFQRRMNAIPVQVRAAVEPALLQGAHEIADVMGMLAPEKTGALKASIVVTGPGEATPPYSQPGGALVVPSNSAAITAGNTDVRYPHLVEHGTKNAPAQPFFWPAFRLTRKKATARIKRAISKAVREAGK